MNIIGKSDIMNILDPFSVENQDIGRGKYYIWSAIFKTLWKMLSRNIKMKKIWMTF